MAKFPGNAFVDAGMGQIYRVVLAHVGSFGCGLKTEKLAIRRRGVAGFQVNVVGCTFVGAGNDVETILPFYNPSELFTLQNVFYEKLP